MVYIRFFFYCCWAILLPALSYASIAAAPASQNTCRYDEVLVMDVWTSYVPEEDVKAFQRLIQEKYRKNIDIQVRKVLTPEDFFDRVRGGVSDIISPSHNFFKDERNQFIRKKLILPVDTSIVTNLKNVQTPFIENEFAKEGHFLYGVPVAAGGYTLLYDKNYFKTPPTHLSILWREDMRGRYALSRNFYEANIYLTVIAMGYKKEDLHNVELINSVAFKKKLKTLLAGARFWEGIPKKEDLNKVVLTMGWGLSDSIPTDTDRWQMAFPEEGLSIWVDYLAVTKNARRSPLALKVAMEWLNYVLSPGFQGRHIVEKKKYLSPLKAEEQSASPTKTYEKEAAYLARQNFYWPIMSARERNGVKRIYDQIMEEITTEPKKF